MEEKKSWTCLSSFVIKLIAFLTMTIDHVGWMLEVNVGGNYIIAVIFRYIGRLALPLFCFMIAEGMIHTKKAGNYLLRLGIMATLISAGFIFIHYSPYFPGFNIRNQGNIFIDLLLGALAILALKQKQWYLKILAIIPFGITVASFIVTCLEFGEGMIIHWFPFFLRPQYHFYSVGMIVLFYVAHYLKNIFLGNYSKKTGIPVESLTDTQIERKALNLISFGMLVFATLVFFIVGLSIPYDYLYWGPGMQNMAILSGAFILLYNGKRGYNAKWFQYGSYFYYPIHLIIIFAIGLLI